MSEEIWRSSRLRKASRRVAQEGIVLHALAVDDVATDGEVRSTLVAHWRNWVARTELTR